MGRLTELRKERGYTKIKMQIQASGNSLLSIVSDVLDISKIESGKRYYTFEQCKRIATALQTSMNYLAGLTDVKDPYPRKADEP